LGSGLLFVLALAQPPISAAGTARWNLVAADPKNFPLLFNGSTAVLIYEIPRGEGKSLHVTATSIYGLYKN
jgi:hypothetical protein